MNKSEFKLYKTKINTNNLNENQTLTSNDLNPYRSNNQSFYILVEFKSNILETNDDIESLWFNGLNGELNSKIISSSTLKELDEIGKVFGYIGKFQINLNHNPKLLFIKKCEQIGNLRVKSKEHAVFKIKEILVINLNNFSLMPNQDSRQDDFANNLNSSFNMFKNSSSISNFSNLNNAPEKTMNNSIPSNEINFLMLNQSVNDSGSFSKLEKKIVEEIVKIFQENNGSFYFCNTFDLTNTIERQEIYFENEKNKSNYPTKLYWSQADERFFWNKNLLKDLIELALSKKKENIDKFILPLIQGYVTIENFEMNLPDSNVHQDSDASILIKLCLISRRNCHRLGTRFRSRGIDERGNVSNFIETEQIIDVYDGHTLSTVLLRGSIPLFWSQPGFNYRPAPRLERNDSENKAAFNLHFDELKEKYPNQSTLVVINLVEEFGKESILGEAYLKLIAEAKRKLIYVQFDFHEHCKGLKFDNVSILKEKIKELISDDVYTWIDKSGFIFKQKTHFRVNCIDCLDRTNVVQMVIAKNALENQLYRLGFFIPPTELPAELKRKFCSIWADNGDAISQQYAGTDALKGDFTRTGERNLTGIMKDGMKSANRFYLRFKDGYRQMALDVLQGSKITDDESISGLTVLNSSSNLQKLEKSAPNVDEVLTQSEREENIRQLVADCKKLLVNDFEDCYGNWALITYNNENCDIGQNDPDVFLLFTSTSIYIANYDDSNETFSDYQKIDLSNVQKLELGPEPASNQQISFFKLSNTAPRFYVLRIYYKFDNNNVINFDFNQYESNKSSENETEYFHSFRSCNLRFFNNLVITTNSSDEMVEALRGICHTIQSTATYFGYNIIFEDCKKLQKKKSKPHYNFIRLSRLSTKMSIDEEYFKQNQQQQPFNVKLNKIGKMITSKFYNIVNQEAAKGESEINSRLNEACFNSEINSDKNRIQSKKLEKSIEINAGTQKNSSYKQYKNKELKVLLDKNTTTSFIFI